MLSNSSQRQLRLEFLETRVNPTRLWFAANALPIPIGTDTTTAITLQVPDALVVGDIDLWVNVTHERMDEISLRLRSPSGTIIQLATKQGGAGKGYQNTIFDDQAANTLATFSDSEGQRFQPEQSLGIFQQLSAQGEWQLLVDDANLQANVGSVNSFKLGFTTMPDDHGDSLSTATPLVSTNVSTWSESGSIESKGDRDWFVWTAPANGSIHFSVNAANGSPIDTYLSLFDSQGVLIDTDDDSGPERNSALFTSVKVGVDYKIEVRDLSISMGSYTVTLAAIDDDHGSTPATATPLTFSGSDTWSSAGSIQCSNDKDWFRWTAPADATAFQVTMDAAAGVLQPYVELLDSNGNSIYDAYAYAYSDSPGGSAALTVLINPGAVYYIFAQSIDASLGSYTLKLILKTIDDDHGFSPATATPLTFSGSDTWSSAGSIQYSNDEDWFRWTAPSDATAIHVTMDAAGGILQPRVTLLDSGGYDIVSATNNSYLPGGSAEFTRPINPGAVYYISAKGDAALGSYTVNVVLITIEDDHGSTLETATPLTLSGPNTWSSSGIIQYSNDYDWFIWTAPADATAIQVTMDAAGGVLHPDVMLLDSGGNFVPDADAYPFLLSPGGFAVFTVLINPSAVYYVWANSYGFSFGSYTLNIMLVTIEDDHGSTPETAAPLTFSGSDTWSGAGSIQYSSDSDWFRWTAPTDAAVIQVTIDAAGGDLQPSIELLDSGGKEIFGAYGYSNSPGGSEVLQCPINPGSVYYIRVKNYHPSYGLYIVNIVLITIEDDHGSTPATSTPLAFSESFIWSSAGRIQYRNDEDWFRWNAPVDATAIQVTMDAAGGVLIPFVELLDSGGKEIFDAFGYSNSSGGSAVYSWPINPGSVYFIRAKSSAGSIGNVGSYTVNLMLITIDDDHGSTPATATPLAFSGSDTWSIAGSIEHSSDSDWFCWTAPAYASSIQVTINAAGGVLKPSVTLLDSDGNNIRNAYDYSNSPGGFAVFTALINPGLVYYIQTPNLYALGSIGSYMITLTMLDDDYGSSPVTAMSLPSLAQWSVTAEINFSLDHDWFKWVVPLGLNQIRITMVNMGLPSQRMVMSIRNMNQVELTGVSVLGGNRQAELLFDVVPGATYYLDASGASSFNSGIYQIFIDPIRMEQIMSQTVGSTDLNFGISMAIITQSGATGSGSTPSDGLTTMLLPAVGSAGGDVSNLAAIQVADEIIGGSDFVVNSGGNAGVSMRDTIRNIKDAQEQLLIELRGFFAIIHTGALEMLLFDADGNSSRLPRQWKLAMAPWVDGVMMELHAVDRQASILFDLTSSGLKRVTAIVPPVWFDTVPAFTLEYAPPDADDSTSPWWASVVLMIGAKTWRIKKKSRLKV